MSDVRAPWLTDEELARFAKPDMAECGECGVAWIEPAEVLAMASELQQRRAAEKTLLTSHGDPSDSVIAIGAFAPMLPPHLGPPPHFTECPPGAGCSLCDRRRGEAMVPE